ncbi:hypothetical protein EPVG_00035 [Emiliania huxleyi virus 201]|nr:hypothetical protein ELVG_00204 [Emiliania huxleyi virus 203]AEP15581.1 hypothetical protein EQVG_00171 [Emiliania huxleyi virus 207]AEP16033.1 hypothetical protein ERVG_00156 [Emiliania huxleyi virus 208]AET97923.1 hypothetical protein EPVG_00035 [Emiliania huxleyi virus 201]
MNRNRVGRYRPRTSVNKLLDVKPDSILQSRKTAREKKAYIQGLIRDADTYLQREAAADSIANDSCSDYLIAKQTEKGCFMSTAISILYQAYRMFPTLEPDARVPQNASYNNKIMPYIMQFLDNRNDICPAVPTTIYAIYNTITDRMNGSNKKGGVPFSESITYQVAYDTNLFDESAPAFSYHLFLRNPLINPILEVNEVDSGLRTIPYSMDQINVINQPRKIEKGGYEQLFIAAMLMNSNAYVVYSEISSQTDINDGLRYISSKVYSDAFHIIEKTFSGTVLPYNSDTLRYLLESGRNAASILSRPNISTELIALTVSYKYPISGQHVVSIVPCGETNAILCNTDASVSSCVYFDDYSYAPTDKEYYMTILDRIGHTYEEQKCTLERVTYYLFNGVTMS